MPAEGLPWLERERDPALRGDRARSCACSRAMGVTDLRLTGGEPLVRRDFPRLRGDARARCPGSRTSRSPPTATCSSATPTALVEAGLKRVNVSIDSLQRDRFFQHDPARLAAPGAARPRGDRRASRGAPDQGQRRRAARLHRGGGAAVRGVRPLHELPGALHRVHAARRRPRLEPRTRCSPARRSARSSTRVHPLEEVPREPHATARVFRFADGAGELGFINPVSEPFCARLQPHPPDRRRQAAHLPLLDPRDRPARRRCAPARRTPSWSGSIRDAVWRKELKHRVGEPGFRQPPRTMSAIGG